MACYHAEYRSTDRGKDNTRTAAEAYRSSPNGHRVRSDYARARATAPEEQARKRRWERMLRERRLGIVVEVPLHYEGLVHEVFGGRCAACGARDRLCLDHHRPLQRGHSLMHNAVLLCARCNRRKGTLPPEEFYSPWKLVEVAVLLFEVRIRLEERFGMEDAA